MKGTAGLLCRDIFLSVGLQLPYQQLNENVFHFPLSFHHRAVFI